MDINCCENGMILMCGDIEIKLSKQTIREIVNKYEEYSECEIKDLNYEIINIIDNHVNETLNLERKIYE